MKKTVFAVSIASMAFCAFAQGADAPTLAHTPVKAGRWKTFTYDKPDKTPVVFGGWSRAEGVRSCEYCVSLDVQYTDGSKEWGLGRQAKWRQGTHDWEYACTALVPKKPIAKIDAFVFNRDGTGKAEFRDIFLERREGKGDLINYARMTVKPFADEDEVSYGIFTGRKTDKKTERAPSTFSFPPPPDGVTVWTASPMELVTPLTLPPDGAGKAIALSLARRERESAQLLVSCGADTELVGVTLEIDPLKDASGGVLAGAVKWERVGYIPRKAGYLRHPCSPEDREMWLPDPLLPAAPFKVRRASTQGAWITVYAAPGAKAGTYRSEVRVRRGGKTLAAIPFAATVLDFELAQTFALDTAFSLMDGFMRVKYPETWRQMKKQAIDVMLDHRLNPDDTARISSPEIEDLLHAKARGMSRFNILNIVPEPKNPEVKWVFSAGTSELFTEEFYQSFTGRLRPYLKKLEANGLDGMAYIYGFDEVPQSYFRGMDRMWRRLKEDFPNLPMMTTSKMFRALVRGKTNDFHCVTTDWYCPVSNDYNLKWADYLRAKGKKVWWYTCCSPGHPFANMASLEYPAVEGRLLLGYLTWLYRADGFLFWHVNNWRTGNEPMDETDTYFPEWNTWNYLGIPEDGIFLYPGKEHILPSIRFANIRDGEEDYEYLLRAEKMLGRKAVEDMVRPLVRSQTDFTRDAAALASLRANLAKGTANTGCASFSGSLDKATAGEAGEPKISVFASFIRRVAKERGISKSEAADLLYSIGVRGFDAGPGDGDLDELAATRLKPINFYYFPDWFGRAERPSTLSPEACLARAAKLGVPRIMVVPPNFTDGKENEEEFGRIMECMRDFVAEAKKRSIAVTVEDFGGIRNCCSYAKYLKRFLDEIPDLRFALDSGNLYYAGRGDDILEMMEFAKGRIGHVHLKDQLAANNREFVTLGLGAVPNEKIVKAVAATGYSGWYTLENPVGDTYNDTVRQVSLLKAWLSEAKRVKSSE